MRHPLLYEVNTRQWLAELSRKHGRDIDLFGVEGRALFHERRCAPDRCAISDLRASDTCGGPTHSALDVSRVPGGSCDDLDAGTNATPHPVEAERKMKIAEGGCRVGATRSRGLARTWPIALAFVGYALRRARRHQR